MDREEEAQTFSRGRIQQSGTDSERVQGHVRMTVDRLDGATEDEIADVDERFVWWLINNGYITYEIDAKGNAVFSYTGRPV